MNKAAWAEATTFAPEVTAARELIQSAPDPRLVYQDPTFQAKAASGEYGAQWQQLWTEGGPAAEAARIGLQTGAVVPYNVRPGGIEGFVQSDVFDRLVIGAISSSAIGALGVAAMRATESAPTPPPAPINPAAAASWMGAYYDPTAALGGPPGDSTMFNGTDTFDWSSVATGLLRTALDYRTQRAQIAQVSGAMAQPVATPVALPMLPALGGMAARLGLGAVATTAVAAGRRLIQTAIGAISRKRVVAIAKTLGIQGAATALGIGAVEIAQMVLDDDKRKGRRGGITGAQMKTTRRTIGKVERLHRQIVAACSSARVPSRSRRSCPPPKVIVAKGR